MKLQNKFRIEILQAIINISLNLVVKITADYSMRRSQSACPERAKELKGFSGAAAAPPQRFARGAPAVAVVRR